MKREWREAIEKIIISRVAFTIGNWQKINYIATKKFDFIATPVYYHRTMNQMLEGSLTVHAGVPNDVTRVYDQFSIARNSRLFARSLMIPLFGCASLRMAILLGILSTNRVMYVFRN